MVFETLDESVAAFLNERCHLLSANRLALAHVRATRMPKPDAYAFLLDVISKEPLGPVVRDDDTQWINIVRWVVFATIVAEEKGVSAESLPALRDSVDPEVRRLLGFDGSAGETLGLDQAWAFRIIQQVGNYGEIFERNLGGDSGMGLERGINAPWTRGGLLFAPPFR